METIRQKSLLILTLQAALCVAAPAPVFAQAGGNQATTSAGAEQSPAGKFVQDLGDKAISILKNKNIGQDQRDNQYHDMLRNAFDLPTIGHFVIGRAWDTATPDQRQEYMKLFEALVTKIYGDRLSLYSGERFHVKSVRQENDQDMMVGSEVDHPNGGEPTSVDWRVRQKDGKIMVVDVIVEGVSQSVTQRQEYSSIIQRDGGKIDGLLETMRQKLQQSEQGGGQ